MATKKLVRSRRMYKTPSGRVKKMPELMRQKQEAARERQIQALDLRKAGATYQEIADTLGYATAQGAKVAVDTMMKRTVFDLAEDIVTLDLQRLDEFQKRCMVQLRQKNDLSQIDRIMRIMDKRYQLAGVAPETVKKIQEAYGLEGAAQIQNNGVMVVQVGHRSEQDFVKHLMGASGVDVESPEARAYLERVQSKTPELEGGTSDPSLGEEQGDTHAHTRNKTQPRKVRVVRSKSGKKKIVIKKKKTSESKAELPIEGVHIGGSDKGVSIEGGRTVDSQYSRDRGVSLGHPIQGVPTHPVLDEEEIIDAEIVDE